MKFLKELAGAVRKRAKIGRTPAVLCGDRLSIAAALATHATGIAFQPYAVAMEAKTGNELQQIADQLGWRLKLILPPVEELPADFIHLAVQYRCFKTHEIELGYVTMRVCEAVEETDVWLSVPRWNMKRYAWPAATRIADHYEKTLFNPYVASDQTHVDADRLRLMVYEAKALTGKI
jgi:hypothetical protein